MNAHAASRPISRHTSPADAPDLLPLGALTHPLWLAACITAVLAAWLLVDWRGWDYYTTPLRVRGYHAMHRALRPSGTTAHLLGVAGWLMLLVPVAYMGRKRFHALRRLGSLRAWLEVHIFCGLVGPVLVTFHTSFKFNGLISVAYWSMAIVALSGVIGRYLYVRIPKTIRGVELTFEQVRARAAALESSLGGTGLGGEARAALDAFPRDRWWRRAGGSRWRQRRLARGLETSGIARGLARELAARAAERVTLGERLGALERRKRLFGLWHVFHLPLVWLMFGIVTLHLAIALYLGYWPSLAW